MEKLALPLRAERDGLHTHMIAIRDKDDKLVCLCYSEEAAALLITMSEDAKALELLDDNFMALRIEHEKLKADYQIKCGNVRQLAEQCSRLCEDARIDGQILDWLERKSVNVREPLAHGSRDLFWCRPEDLDGDEGPSNLRLTCHKHMRAENKAALAAGDL